MRENLKNVVLSMSSSNYLVPPASDPSKEELWTETWKRIDRFLPELKGELALNEQEGRATRAIKGGTTARPVLDQETDGWSEYRRGDMGILTALPQRTYAIYYADIYCQFCSQPPNMLSNDMMPLPLAERPQVATPATNVYPLYCIKR